MLSATPAAAPATTPSEALVISKRKSKRKRRSDFRFFQVGAEIEPGGSTLAGKSQVAIYRAMNGAELRKIREAYGLSAAAMGRALGYTGPRANIAVTIRRLERDTRRIPIPIARLAEMFAQNGIPKEWYA